MLRDNLNDALKVALKAQDKASLGTIRLILASIKDQDISVRADGNSDGVSDAQILSLLQTMVKQRNESIRLYEDCLLYTSPSPRDKRQSRMPSSA